MSWSDHSFETRLQILKILKSSNCKTKLVEPCYSDKCYLDLEVVEKKIYKPGEAKYNDHQCRIDCKQMTSCESWTLQYKDG